MKNSPAAMLAVSKFKRKTPPLTSSKKVFTKYQSFIGHMWQYRNITESKQAEEDLKASEARNHALLNAHPDLINLIHYPQTLSP